MERVQKRFDELAETAEKILDSFDTKTRTVSTGPSFIRTDQRRSHRTVTTHSLNSDLMVQWSVSVQNLLSKVFGSESPTYERFSKIANPYRTSQVTFRELRAIFLSAKDDFEGGYIFDVRKIIHADLFDNELEQATYFLGEGYKVPAAVIAGTVLESCLRQLCEDHDVESGNTLNPMNDALGKANVLNKLQKKQVTTWADIRNSAAHGKPDDFEDNDVKRMIDGVRDFVVTKLS